MLLYKTEIKVLTMVRDPGGDFMIFIIYSCGSPYVRRSETICPVRVEDFTKNISVKLF